MHVPLQSCRGGLPTKCCIHKQLLGCLAGGRGTASSSSWQHTLQVQHVARRSANQMGPKSQRHKPHQLPRCKRTSQLKPAFYAGARRLARIPTQRTRRVRSRATGLMGNRAPQMPLAIKSAVLQACATCPPRTFHHLHAPHVPLASHSEQRFLCYKGRSPPGRISVSASFRACVSACVRVRVCWVGAYMWLGVCACVGYLGGAGGGDLQQETVASDCEDHVGATCA